MTDDLEGRVHAAMNGEAARELRRLVPLTDLRGAGAFFTGEDLAWRALRVLTPTLERGSVILDPACGAGDLLLRCALALPHSGSVPGALKRWTRQIIGRDLHPVFVRVARQRLLLAFLVSKGYSSKKNPTPEEFNGLEVACGLHDKSAFQRATHIVLNPPFIMMDSPKGCTWSGGKVNAAAVFVDHVLEQARPGTRIAAILPDVLRSGSRYRHWREQVMSRARLERVETYGRFDGDADVDVFLLDLLTKPIRKCEQPASGQQPEALWIPEVGPAERFGERFEIRIGPVVDYRDPERGAEYPFIHSRDLEPWAKMGSFPRRRRFGGRVFRPPFVAVRRTSRPGDEYRAMGTIVTGEREIAVENHLICLVPKRGGLPACYAALKRLKDPRTTEWLDRRIRCRHLTVSALAELPWWKGDGA